jgi:hypothetical protein
MPTRHVSSTGIPAHPSWRSSTPGCRSLRTLAANQSSIVRHRPDALTARGALSTGTPWPVTHNHSSRQPERRRPDHDNPVPPARLCDSTTRTIDAIKPDLARRVMRAFGHRMHHSGSGLVRARRRPPKRHLAGGPPAARSVLNSPSIGTAARVRRTRGPPDRAIAALTGLRCSVYSKHRYLSFPTVQLIAGFIAPPYPPQ